MSPTSLPHAESRWPHRVAWVLACTTFPLIWVGAFVTTTDAGMAFRDWMTSDGTFFLIYDWLGSAGDKFTEHGHRLLGAAAGFLSIALVAVTWRVEKRDWVRWFSVGILAAVIGQGVLGGMRVVLDERTLAMIHGCTGPLFFSLCVAMVVFTSRRWAKGPTKDPQSQLGGLNRLAWATFGLSYCQLMVGAAVRHSPMMLNEAAASMFRAAVYFHVLLALVISGHALWLAARSLRCPGNRRLGLAVGGLVGVQFALGIGTWVVKYGVPEWGSRIIGEPTFVNTVSSGLLAGIVTTHVAVGSLILVTSLTAALFTSRELGHETSWSRRQMLGQTGGAVA
ncbi:MAG: COX15/CtaA family protein [Planctomycetota bacterium]